MDEGACKLCTFMLVLFTALGLVIAGTNDWKSLRDIDKWEETQCQPKYWSQGGECCLRYNSKNDCLVDGRDSDYWRKVSDARCADENILKQHGDSCAENDFFTTWPVGSYTEEFIRTNQTEKCWTDCVRYEMEDPIGKHTKAQLQLGFGYGIFLSGLFIPCFLYYTQPDFGRHEDGLFEAALMYMYFIHWISISNCTFHISDDCKVLAAGYYLNWLTPLIVILAGILHHSCDFDLDAPISQGFPILTYAISILLLAIGAGTPPDGDLKSCFNVTFCEKQLYTTFSIYGILFGLPLLIFLMGQCKNKYDECSRKRDEWRDKTTTENTKLSMLRDIERKWQGQKDIIFPLIDYREHIWNEIWTLCWEMEYEFFNISVSNQELQAEIWSSDLRQAATDYNCSVDDFSFGVYGRLKCCSRKTYFTMEMIAKTKGQIYWKTSRSKPDLISRYSSNFFQFVTAPHQKAYERQMSREVQELGKTYYGQIEIQTTFDGGSTGAPLPNSI